MTLIHTGLLLFLPLVGVVVLIHLIRVRRRPVAWGAWYFLAQAARKTRTKTRFHSLLLLILRCLILTAVVFLLAGPTFIGQKALPEQAATDPESADRPIEIALISAEGMELVGDGSGDGHDRFVLFALEAALAPDVQEHLRIRTVSASELTATSLGGVDLAFMVATTLRVPEDGPLAAFLASGHTLCLVPGEACSEPLVTADPVQTCREGDGLAFPVFQTIPELGAEIAVFQWVDLSEEEANAGEPEGAGEQKAGWTALGTLAGGQAFLDYRPAGSGHVVRFHTSWSENWSNLASTLAFPILIQELVARFGRAAVQEAEREADSAPLFEEEMSTPFLPNPVVLFAGVALILALMLGETYLANRPFAAGVLPGRKSP